MHNFDHHTKKINNVVSSESTILGCIFDVQFRTRRDGKFQILGQPAGHPAFGRSVGQCGVTPCVHVHCKNGGTCVDSGSSV